MAQSVGRYVRDVEVASSSLATPTIYHMNRRGRARSYHRGPAHTGVEVAKGPAAERGQSMRVGVVGAGIFGMGAALELRSRGHHVTLFEQGAIPYENASSTDVAKAIRRVNYAPHHPYAELVERSGRKWAEWQRRLGGSFYFQCGQLSIYSESELTDGGDALSSIEHLESTREEFRTLTRDQAAERFPQLAFDDTDERLIFDSWAGYLASGQAVSDLARLAKGEGVALKEHSQVLEVNESASGVDIATENGCTRFDRVVVAAGPWVGRLLPSIGESVLISRQQMAFFRPVDPAPFRAGVFPGWSWHPKTQGWYGFPLLADGNVKIANDMVGEEVDSDVEGTNTDAFLEEVREFAARRLPELAKGKFLGGRSCLYTNTPDGHFVVDWAPGRSKTIVAGGGSGHGFKFGGSIGEVVADAVEDRANPLGDLFRIGDRLNSEGVSRRGRM